MERSLKQLDLNIQFNEELVERYAEKREKLSAKPVKFSHSLICGTAGAIAAIFVVKKPAFDLMTLACVGGYAVGFAIPHIIKKIRIADLDYQININSKIVDDLKREKQEKVKTL